MIADNIQCVKPLEAKWQAASSPNDIALVPLTRNLHAIIDVDVVEAVTRYSWYAHNTRSHNRYCAATNVEVGGERKTLLLDRFIWELKHGAIPTGLLLHHIDSNPLDCRLNNLQLATQRGITADRKRREGSTSSKLPGVSYVATRGKWLAQVRLNGRKINLGLHKTEKLAHEMYRQAVEKHDSRYMSGEVLDLQPVRSV